MYLPDNLPKARVLITVKTYPQPSGEYYELVCTAGLFEGKKWIRIYPVPFRFLKEDTKYTKYTWIEADLERHKKDFRPESYRFKDGDEANIQIVDWLSTDQNWAERSKYVLGEVYDSMNELIADAKPPKVKSLATLKPKEVINFHIKPTDREWKQKWLNKAAQITIDDYDEKNRVAKERELIRKLPYKYYYSFISEGDQNPRRLEIEDWEIGALYWNCYYRTGDEDEANHQVRIKYFDQFMKNNDIHFFLGTTKRYHHVGPNPFMIIGVYYPPYKHQQLSF